MTDKPIYRWEARRAAKERKRAQDRSVSTHDMILLAILFAMLLIVLRFVLIFGITQGMQIGPFITDISAMPYEPSPYVNMTSVNDSFETLSSISLALGAYWLAVSWKALSSSSVKFGTKLFKSLIGVSIIVLWACSKLTVYGHLFV